jgi:hypothetical protein
MTLWQRFITWLLSLPFQGEFERECAYWREFDAAWRSEMEKHWSEYCEEHDETDA